MVCVRLKNIFGERWKQSYRDVKISAKPTQTCGLAANANFLAFPWDVGGGGMVAVTPLDVVGRDTKSTKLKGHTGAIMDMVFNAFNDKVLATASDDCTVRIWDVDISVPEIAAARAHMNGHTKKISNIVWNPAADYILASGAMDSLVKVWDASTATEFFSANVDDAVCSVSWDPLGETLSVSTKEANVYMIDPKSNGVLNVFKAHDSAKATHVAHLGGDYGEHLLVTTGFVGNHTRQQRIWDSRNTGTHLLSKEVDSSSSPLLPHWDPLTGILCLTAKGDLTVRIFQYFESELNRSGEFKTTGTIKSFCWLPSDACDKSKCELGRFFSNEDCKEINATSLIIMRRNTEASMREIYGEQKSKRRTTALDWTSGVSHSFAVASADTDDGARGRTPEEHLLQGLKERLNKVNLTRVGHVEDLEAVCVDLQALVDRLKNPCTSVTPPAETLLDDASTTPIVSGSYEISPVPSADAPTPIPPATPVASVTPTASPIVVDNENVDENELNHGA